MENCIRFPHLLKCEILDGLDVAYKKEFLNACTVKTYKSRTMIFEQGEPSSGMMLLAHGFVDVTYIGEDGQQVFLARAKAGFNLGESEAIADEPCAATCTTSRNATLLACTKPQLFQALQKVEFVKNMAKMFHRRLAYNNWLKHVSQFGAVGQRLRGYLYLLAETSLIIDETQSYLANVVGCSRQTVNRELAKLRDEGLIEQHGSQIIVFDRDKLGEGLMP